MRRHILTNLSKAINSSPQGGVVGFNLTSQAKIPLQVQDAGIESAEVESIALIIQEYSFAAL